MADKIDYKQFGKAAAFIEKWDNAAAGDRPTGDGHNCCMLCGGDIFPHVHDDLQREHRAAQFNAGMVKE